MGHSELDAQKALEELVGHQYTCIETNLEYKFRECAGEIDFMGRSKEGTWDIYEIKTRPKRKLVEKAIVQLNRAREYFNVRDTFIFYSDTNQIEKV